MAKENIIGADTSDVRAYLTLMERLSDGLSEMKENGFSDEKIEQIKDQIGAGYIPPEFRIGSDLAQGIPVSMRFEEKEVGAIRKGSSDDTEGIRELKTSYGIGVDFARHIGIDTSHTHYVTAKGGPLDEVGKKIDFKEALVDVMDSNLIKSTSAVYVMHDYSRIYDSTFTVEGENGKKYDIPFHDFRITTFVFEKNDGSVDSAVVYTNEAGYKLGEMLGATVDGFNWEGKLDAIDDFKDKISSIPVKDIEVVVENYGKERAIEAKEEIYDAVMQKTESVRDKRMAAEEMCHEKMDASKSVCNLVMARYDQMSEILSGLKMDIVESCRVCAYAEKNGTKEEITEAKQELFQKIKEYIDTRKEFLKELPSNIVENVQREYSVSARNYESVKEKNDFTYGNSEARDKSNTEYTTDSRFFYAVQSERGKILIIEDSPSLSSLDKIATALESGKEYLQIRVDEWNKNHPDNKISLQDDGIVRDESGREFLSFFKDGVDYFDKKTDGFIPFATKDSFELKGPSELLKEQFSAEGVEIDTEAYEKELIKVLGGYEDYKTEEVKIEEEKSDKTDAAFSFLGKDIKINSERDIHRIDSHINTKGSISLSDKKIEQIKKDVLKEMKVDISRYEQRKDKISQTVTLSDKETKTIETGVLKTISGRFDIYQKNYEVLTNKEKDRIGKSEIYSRLGVDYAKVKEIVMDRIGSVTLSPKQMESIDKETSFRAKREPMSKDNIRSSLILERKELIAEGIARKELGISPEEYARVRDEVRSETELSSDKKDSIAFESRKFAGYNEDTYQAAMSERITSAKEEKAEKTTNFAFHIDNTKYQEAVKQKTMEADTKLVNLAKKIDLHSSRLTRWADFDRLKMSNTFYHIEKYRLHQAVDAYVKAGGSIGDDKLVKYEYKTMEKISDLISIVKSNLLESIIFEIAYGIDKAYQDHKDKVEVDKDNVEAKADTPFDEEVEDFEKTTADETKDDVTVSELDKTEKGDGASEEKTDKEEVEKEEVEKKDVDEEDTEKEDKISESEETEDKVSNSDTTEDKVTNDEDKDDEKVDSDKKSDSNEEDKSSNDENKDEKDDTVSNDKKDDTELEKGDLSDEPTREESEVFDGVDYSDEATDLEEKGLSDEETRDILEKIYQNEEVDETDEDSISSDVESDEDNNVDSSEENDLEEKDEEVETSNADEVDSLNEKENKEEVIEDDDSDEEAVSSDSDSEEKNENNKDEDSSKEKNNDVETEENVTSSDVESKEDISKDEDSTDVESEDSVILDEEPEEHINTEVSSDEPSSDDPVVKEYDEQEEVEEPTDEYVVDEEEEDSEFEKIMDKYFDEEDSLSDMMSDYLERVGDEFTPFDLMDNFAGYIIEHLGDENPTDIAEALDTFTDELVSYYGEGAPEMYESFYTQLEGYAEERDMDISSYIENIEFEMMDIIDSKGEFPVEQGFIGGVEFSDDGSFLDGTEATPYEVIVDEAIEGFMQPETVSMLQEDAAYADKLESLSSYIQDAIEGGFISVPDGVEFTPSDASQIAGELLDRAISDGSMQIDTGTGMEIGDYWADDSSIQQLIDNHTTQATEPDILDMEAQVQLDSDTVDLGIGNDDAAELLNTTKPDDAEEAMDILGELL